MRGGRIGEVGLAGHSLSSRDSLRSCLTTDLCTFLPYNVPREREKERERERERRAVVQVNGIYITHTL